jgi:hypothetical protein
MYGLNRLCHRNPSWFPLLFFDSAAEDTQFVLSKLAVFTNAAIQCFYAIVENKIHNPFGFSLLMTLLIYP